MSGGSCSFENVTWCITVSKQVFRNMKLLQLYQVETQMLLITRYVRLGTTNIHQIYLLNEEFNLTINSLGHSKQTFFSEVGSHWVHSEF